MIITDSNTIILCKGSRIGTHVIHHMNILKLDPHPIRNYCTIYRRSPSVKGHCYPVSVTAESAHPNISTSSRECISKISLTELALALLMITIIILATDSSLALPAIYF